MDTVKKKPKEPEPVEVPKCSSCGKIPMFCNCPEKELKK